MFTQVKPVTSCVPSTACRATRSNTLRCALCSESISIGGIANAAACPDDTVDAEDKVEEVVDVKGDEKDEEVANR